MVDFDELKDQAQNLVREHSDQIKEGVQKLGQFAGEKLGEDKVNPITEKVEGFIDKLAGHQAEPTADAEPPAES